MLPELPPITLNDIGYGWVHAWLWAGASAVCVVAAITAYVRKGK
jgi:hypothetical protein